MNLPSYIMPLPRSFSNLPILRIYKGFLLFKTIYFQKEIYDDLLSKQPKHEYIGYLVHEKVHYQRVKEVGMLKFGLRYLFTRKWRFYEEFIAYREQALYLKKHGKTLNIERVARALSSWIYLWCVSYEKAKRELEKV